MHFLPALGRHITAPELWETRPNEQRVVIPHQSQHEIELTAALRSSM